MEQYVGVDWKKYIDLTKPFNKNIIYPIKKYGISFKMLAPKIMKHYIIIIQKTVVCCELWMEHLRKKLKIKN